MINTQQNIIGLFAWLLICFIAASLGALASIDVGTFYASLQKPSWAPPAAIFGPMWTLLYALMAVSAWFIWREGGFKKQSHALGLFLVQLVFNSLWSFLFFSWKFGFLSVVDIVMLWILLFATVFLFWRIKPLAGALLIPYLL